MIKQTQETKEIEMNNRQALYESLEMVAQEIDKTDSNLGFYAKRKVEHVSANSDIDALYKVCDDLTLMVNKIANS